METEEQKHKDRGGKIGNMSPGKKRALLAIGGLIAAMGVALLAVALFVDINRYKPRLEAAVSGALGLEVRIRGEMNIAFFPPIGMTLDGLRAARDEEDVLRVERMRVDLKILPLLLGRIRIRDVAIVHPELSLRRTSRGPFDFERYLYRPLQNAREALPGTFDHIDRVSVTGGTVSYDGKDPAIRVRVEDLGLAIQDIALPAPPGEKLFGALSLAGTVMAAEADVGNLEFSGITFRVTANNGNYEIDPVSLKVFGGTAEGNVWVNLSSPIPLVQVRYVLSGADIGSMSAASGRKREIPEGNVDLFANLFMKGSDLDALRGTMTGDLSWTGKDLAFQGFDPDALLSAPGDRKGIRLPRVGALLLSSPPLAAATRGLSAPDNAAETVTGGGRIGTLVSAWTVKNAVFEAKDVALATHEHRVALTGRIDLPGERFEEVTVALVDDKGCTLAGQTIRGTFRHPRIEEASVAKTVASPEEGPAGDSKKPVPQKGCEVFYAGSVPPPE